MLIPYNTDAPIYHGPWATIGMIVANCAVFIVTFGGAVDAEPLVLDYGTINPLEWVTSNFVHGDLMHLAGNMIFLWSFGLVVEGKIGWKRFIAVYFGLGIAQSAFEQFIGLALAQEGGSYGASAIIYGLMAMALVWAPSNEMQCLLLVRFSPIHVDISILTMSLLYILIEIGITLFSGLMITSSVLHLMGAVLGFVLGTVMLKTRQVDCEHWDLYTLVAGRQGEPPQTSPGDLEARERKAEAAVQARTVTARAQIATLLEAGEVRQAYDMHRKMVQRRPGWQLHEEPLFQLISGLNRQRSWEEAVGLMVEYVQRFPDKAAKVRLKLGQVLLREQKRPAQAISVLRKIPPGSLDESLVRLQNQLIQSAESQRGQIMELAVEDW